MLLAWDNKEELLPIQVYRCSEWCRQQWMGCDWFYNYYVLCVFYTEREPRESWLPYFCKSRLVCTVVVPLASFMNDYGSEGGQMLSVVV